MTKRELIEALEALDVDDDTEVTFQNSEYNSQTLLTDVSVKRGFIYLYQVYKHV